MFIQCLCTVFDKVGNHDGNFHRAGGGECHIGIDRDQFTLIHGKVDLLPILQVLQIDTDYPVKFSERDILLEQDLQILHGGPRRRAALEGKHNFTVAGGT